MTQLICHLIGDYPLQNSWMALNKEKQWIPATIHGFCYSIPFIIFSFLGHFPLNLLSYTIIVSTHIVIDRYALAKKFGDWWLGDKLPDYMSFWLKVLYDNTLHLTINYLVIYYV